MSKTVDLPYASAIYVRDHCLCLHVERAGRALARRFDKALRPFGLTSGQFSLLISLNRPAAATMASVAALLAMDRTTLTAALKPLGRRGLVAVTINPEDRRGRLLTLTEAGREVVASALPVWEQTHAEIEAELMDVSPDHLRQSLRALTARATLPPAVQTA